MFYLFILFYLLPWNACEAISQNRSTLCILIFVPPHPETCLFCFAVVQRIIRGSPFFRSTVCTPDPLVSVTCSSLNSFFNLMKRISCTMICCFLSVAHLSVITLTWTWRRTHPCRLLELSLAEISFWQRRLSHSQFPLRMTVTVHLQDSHLWNQKCSPYIWLQWCDKHWKKHL